MSNEKRSDSELLDFLESQGTGYGMGWVARPSTTGRGYRLHETSGAWYHIEPKPTVREAVNDAMDRAARGEA